MEFSSKGSLRLWTAGGPAWSPRLVSIPALRLARDRSSSWEEHCDAGRGWSRVNSDNARLAFRYACDGWIVRFSERRALLLALLLLQTRRRGRENVPPTILRIGTFSAQLRLSLRVQATAGKRPVTRFRV
jgi:hypothetical protein